MSAYNYFVNSSSSTAISDVAYLRHHQAPPTDAPSQPDDCWVLCQSNSLAVYSAAAFQRVPGAPKSPSENILSDDDGGKEGSPYEELRPSPLFVSDLYTDIHRMVHWAPPPEREGLLLLSESLMLYLIYIDIEKRGVRVETQVNLNDPPGFKSEVIPLIAVNLQDSRFVCTMVHHFSVQVVRVDRTDGGSCSFRPPLNIRLPDAAPICMNITRLSAPPPGEALKDAVRHSTKRHRVGRDKETLTISSDTTDVKEARADNPYLLLLYESAPRFNQCMTDKVVSNGARVLRALDLQPYLEGHKTALQAEAPVSEESSDALWAYLAPSPEGYVGMADVVVQDAQRSAVSQASVKASSDSDCSDENEEDTTCNASLQDVYLVMNAMPNHIIAFGSMGVTLGELVLPDRNTSQETVKKKQANKGTPRLVSVSRHAFSKSHRMEPPLYAAQVTSPLWLLGDSKGSLLLIGLEADTASKISISYRSLGIFNPLSSMSLSPTLNQSPLLLLPSRKESVQSLIQRRPTPPPISTNLFLGSRSGDSFLMDLSLHPLSVMAPSTSITERHRLTHLGPIVDILPVDLFSNGQTQLLLACGFASTGSLKIMTPGVGLTQLTPEEPRIDASVYNRIFEIARNEDGVVSIMETGPAGSRLDELSEGSIKIGVKVEGCLDLEHRTLHATFIERLGITVQVLEDRMLLLDSTSMNLIEEVKIDGVTCVSMSGDRIALGTRRSVSLYEITSERRVHHIGTTEDLEEDVSAIALYIQTLVVTDYRNSIHLYIKDNFQHASFTRALPGLDQWDNGVFISSLQLTRLKKSPAPRLCNFPTLQEYEDPDSSPSALSDTPTPQCDTTEGPSLTLLAGTSHGGILQSHVVKDALSNVWKHLAVGGSPVVLCPVGRGRGTDEVAAVAACADKSCVVFQGPSGRLQSAGLGFTSPRALLSISLPLIKRARVKREGVERVLWIEENTGTLHVGEVGSVQRIQVKSIPLRVSLERLAYHKSSRTIAVAAVKERGGGGQQDPEARGCMILVDAMTDQVKRINYEVGEYPSAIATGTLRHLDEEGEVLIIGSVTDPKTSKGALRVYMHKEGAFVIIAEDKDAVAVSAIKIVQGGFLLVSGSTQVLLYDILKKKADDVIPGVSPLTYTFKLLAHEAAHCYIHDMDVKGDFVVLGAVSRSLALYHLSTPKAAAKKTPDPILREIAADFSPLWCTAVAAPTPQNLLMADDDKSIGALTLEVKLRASQDTQTPPSGFSLNVNPELKSMGGIHTGQSIHRLTVGTLRGDEEGLITTYWGSCEGATGSVMLLFDEAKFKRFMGLESAIAKQGGGLGISHQSYRYPMKRNGETRGFIDGNVIEAFLDFPRELQEKLFVRIKKKDPEVFTNLDELLDEIEAMQRLHF